MKKKPKSSKEKDIITSYLLGLGSSCIGTALYKGLPMATLDFTNMKQMGKVGTDVDSKNLEGPVARLVFFNELGFDNLIERVKDLKKSYLAKRKEYDATINISLGCTDKLGKSPRKGKASGMHNASPNKRRRRSGKSKQASR